MRLSVMPLPILISIIVTIFTIRLLQHSWVTHSLLRLIARMQETTVLPNVL